MPVSAGSEAFVGMEALRYLGKERALVRLLSENLKARPGNCPPRSPTWPSGCGPRRRSSSG